ncbi:MAG: putative glycoside hydrolase [Candidatus Falkowbacteria bacterium]
MSRKFLFIICLIVVAVAPGLICATTAINHDFPKLANLFFRWDITSAEAKQLAQWDILVIDMEVARLTPASLNLIKQYNPNIKLLAYLASADIRGDAGGLSGSLRQKLFNQIGNNWWLRDVGGNKIEWWPGNPLVNVYSAQDNWSATLSQFLKDDLMASGYWDGVFLDNVWSDVSFLQGKFSVDIDNDGVADDSLKLNQKWQEGMIKLLQNVRSKIGSDKLLVTNGGEFYHDSVSGVLYEHFPDKGWRDTMKKYSFIIDNGQYPGIGILNMNVDNTGNKNDFQKMRFGLASAMLDDGYYSFDNGDQTHHEIWWYDEYDAYLGPAVGGAKEVFGKADFRDGVWRRDFENGLVIANSSGSTQQIMLDGEYEKIHGTQDPDTNDGSFVEDVELAPRDGLVLLRPIDKLTNAVFSNGSFARILNGTGQSVRNGFFAYESKFKGGTQMIKKDVNGDGQLEMVVADLGKINIFAANGDDMGGFWPYSDKYKGTINFALVDVDKNGTMEIVTGPGKGVGPHIKIFNLSGKMLNPGFMAYAQSVKTGVTVAVGDIDGNGANEIITGAGFGGGPHVRIFNLDGQLINPGFFAYSSKSRTGVNVAVGDINGDGRDEIITGSGVGAAPQIKIFDKRGAVINSFYAFSETLRDGVKVAAVDVDGDKTDEIIALTTNVFTLSAF